LTGKKENLDNIAISLSKQVREESTESFVREESTESFVREESTESFVVKATKANEELELKFAIVKHVIDVKLAEQAAAKTAAENKTTIARLTEILARKEDQELEGLSKDEIRARIAATRG
jgi:pyruvate-formate lyase